MKTTFSPDLILKKTDLKGLVRIFDYLPGVMFFAKDLEGRFIMANQAFAARFGFKNTHEILGKNDAQIGSSPEIISHYIKKDREVIESGKPQPGIIELFPNENGEHVWYETTKIPLWDTEGKVCGVCGIIKSYEGSPGRALAARTGGVCSAPRARASFSRLPWVSCTGEASV